MFLPLLPFLYNQACISNEWRHYDGNRHIGYSSSIVRGYVQISAKSLLQF